NDVLGDTPAAECPRPRGADVDSAWRPRYLPPIRAQGLTVLPLLEVKNLHTGAGLVRAVDGISYTVDPGETVAIVGESGSGKSVSALSIMRLIPDPPGRITGGEVWFGGRDLMTL